MDVSDEVEEYALAATWASEIGQSLRVQLRIKPEYCIGRKQESMDKELDVPKTNFLM